MTRRLALILACLMPASSKGMEDPPPQQRYATPEIDLAGRWILTMPSGAQWNATFEKNCRCNHIDLRCGGGLLQGEYEMKGGWLAVAKPTDEKLTGLVWKIRNRNLLELVEHPVASQFGSDYRGAVLVRRIDEDRPHAARTPGEARQPPGASITFVSDSTWDVLDASDKPVGKAERVGLGETTPASTVPGTLSFGIGGDGWAADLSAIPEAHWIWAPGLTGRSPAANLATYTFTKRFTLDAPPASGTIWIAADDHAEIFVNERRVGEIGSTSDGASAHESQVRLHDFDITRHLVRGPNTVRIRVQNGPATFSGYTEANYSQNPAGLVIGGKVILARD
ncbi:MAG: heme-binding protein [Planctomycetota bacterium]|nr:heme-binding protein [Planctomycetota bacterium]